MVTSPRSCRKYTSKKGSNIGFAPSYVEEILGDIPTSAQKIGDHMCETELKVGVQMWFQSLWARVGTSQKETSISRIWTPKPRFLESGRMFGFERESVLDL